MKEYRGVRKVIRKLELFGRKIVRAVGPIKMESKFNQSPIIIGGCGRSGTTLLLSIIGAHPNIFSFPDEVMAFFDWEKDDKGIYKPQRIDRLYRSILFNRIPKGVNRWCEKSPPNVLYFDKILDYFNEDVYLIHIIRDGRDVMLSQHPKNPDEYWVSSERWINDVQAGLKFKDHPQVLTIKYENLIVDYNNTIEKICDFIGENCTEEVYSWIENTNVKKNEAWSGKVKKLHSSSIEKWKKEENKERVTEVMQNQEVVRLLEKLDYL
jgi:hypothetical protein